MSQEGNQGGISVIKILVGALVMMFVVMALISLTGALIIGGAGVAGMLVFSGG